MKNLVTILALLFYVHTAKSQMYSPVKWSYVAKKIGNNEAMLYIKGVIEQGWHVFSVNQPNGGPLRTSFAFKPSKDYSLAGKVMEPQPIRQHDKTFKIDIFYFEEAVIFQQKIKLINTNTTVSGKIEYMACTDGMCTPPLDIQFSIPIK
ncbi:protein-disulfide reductase DsbD domain-containing protein [Pedobacter heparinus]|uniref:Thiol:disulfide interchange protein DsbD N-terminal domain-containing protein n=1 Tax=Pedobacter heparinus (strain ATCC 13125 / DSM 2366 / CIP 104194 / JCM 7457 / NBRC 12017 / NCIMB 9290 / NRRL B-14731 / HIM 762-3) TaxID=485917 RepID=C6XWQ7_PEDHD|nr:protein-disulfide reductase DsbD domain-containing protein [Pedobacter heparinus]ACU04201.1 hypothetical protein Phep_1994 [Pedobacter heparinus DSM 2366]